MQHLLKKKTLNSQGSLIVIQIFDITDKLLLKSYLMEYNNCCTNLILLG